jgi:hypothetical protein
MTDGDELLREAERLRDGPVLPDRTEVLAPETSYAAHADEAPGDAGPRLRDPGALLIGAWFAFAGIVSALVGESRLDDVPPVIVPISFAVVGLGLLLPKRRPPAIR